MDTNNQQPNGLGEGPVRPNLQKGGNQPVRPNMNGQGVPLQKPQMRNPQMQGNPQMNNLQMQGNPMGNPQMGNPQMQGNPQMGNPMPTQGYGQQYYGNSMQPQKKNTLAIVSLVLSIISLICCGPLMAIPGLICAIISIVKNGKSGKAIAAIVISSISIILWIILWCAGLISFNGIKTQINDYTGDSQVEASIDDNDEDVPDLDEDIEEDDTLGDTSEKVVDSDEAKASTKESSVDASEMPTITVNGYDLTVGVTTMADVKDLLGDAYNDSADLVINPGYYNFIVAYPSGKFSIDEEPFTLYFLNTADEAVPMSDCVFCEFNAQAHDYLDGQSLKQDGKTTFNVFGITPDSTLEDIEAIFGEPYHEYAQDEYGLVSYSFGNIFDDGYSMDVSFNASGLCEISIRWV